MKNFTCAMGWNLVWTCTLFWGEILFEHVHYFTRMYNTLTANLYRLIFVLIRLQLRNIFTTLCCTQVFFSMCLVCRLESLFLWEKLMACYNFGPNAKKTFVKYVLDLQKAKPMF